jgi:hypothetical protein
MEVKSAGAEPSNTAALEIQRLRLQAQRHIARLRKIQAMYSPIVVEKLLEADGDQDIDMEDEKLWLPSDLLSVERVEGCVEGLATKEDALRFAQCLDALERIRTLEQSKLSLAAFCNFNIYGQIGTARAQSEFSSINNKVFLAAERYRHARHALLSLHGHGVWESRLCVLKQVDIRGSSTDETSIDLEDDERHAPGDGPVKRKKANKVNRLAKKRARVEERNQGNGGEQLGEGTREISWIWMVEGALGSDSDAGRQEGMSDSFLVTLDTLLTSTGSPQD